MKNKEALIVFLYILLSGLTFNFIGSLSLSEIYLIIISKTIIKRNDFIRYPLLKPVTKAYGIYFLIQVISEILIQNELNNWLRGLAVTIISFLSFFYLFKKIVKNNSLIIIILLASVVRLIIFPNTSILTDANKMVFFKFYLSPIIGNITIIGTYFLVKNNKLKIAITILFSLGIFFIANDSRSQGLIFIFIAILMQFGSLAKKQKIIISIWVLSLSYVAYFYYVNSVLNKSFGGEHTYIQIKRLNNPYNPFELLITGRAEAFAALEAIKDSPWIGHGTWAMDKGGKYHYIVLKLQKDDNVQLMVNLMDSGKNVAAIPSHSIILGAGVYNGMFALLSIVYIIFFFLKKGVQAIDYKSSYLAILLQNIISLSWISMFSTISQFKNDLPLIFAIILSLYVAKYRKDFKNNNVNANTLYVKC